MIDVDLFCGAGGASVGLASLGLHPVGFEWNRDACITHHAAGFATVRADLATWPWPGGMRGQVRLLHGSPPCQPFSAAGSGVGDDDLRDGMPWMLTAVAALEPELVTIENVKGLTFDKHAAYLGSVLARLRALGYEVDHRVLDAADFGVPQNRERLFIVARRDGRRPAWPCPTHVEGDSLFCRPWVSMAEALGWGMTGRPYPTIASSRTSGGPDATGLGGTGARRSLDRERDEERWALRTGTSKGNRNDDGTWTPNEFEVDDPSPTVTPRSDRWMVGLPRLDDGMAVIEVDGVRYRARDLFPVDRPSPAVTTKCQAWKLFTEVDQEWCHARPSTTIAADPRIFPPGGHLANDGRDNTRMIGRSEQTIRVTLAELAHLQAFPPSYPFHGTRTSVARQIGNAIPAPLIAAVVGANL